MQASFCKPRTSMTNEPQLLTGAMHVYMHAACRGKGAVMVTETSAAAAGERLRRRRPTVIASDRRSLVQWKRGRRTTLTSLSQRSSYTHVDCCSRPFTGVLLPTNYRLRRHRRRCLFAAQPSFFDQTRASLSRALAADDTSSSSLRCRRCGDFFLRCIRLEAAFRRVANPGQRTADLELFADLVSGCTVVTRRLQAASVGRSRPRRISTTRDRTGTVVAGKPRAMSVTLPDSGSPGPSKRSNERGPSNGVPQSNA